MSPVFDPSRVAGLRWYENGQSALTGALLGLDRRLDRMFVGWAQALGAEEHRFPTFLPARDLARLDYFRSFPHLVTFPVTLDPGVENLRRFASHALGPGGELELETTAPVRDVLTPAACYHVYVNLRGEELAAPRLITTRATCFRREEFYRPLQRQWSFSMREIVCLGTAGEVQAFLERCQALVDAFFRRAELDIEWREATDPFFDPSHSAKCLLQKLDPVKREMIFQGELALGSANFHRSYFGEAFEIARDGVACSSGCVAFGVERWIYAILARFGEDPARWPALEKRP